MVSHLLVCAAQLAPEVGLAESPLELVYFDRIYDTSQEPSRFFIFFFVCIFSVAQCVSAGLLIWTWRPPRIGMQLVYVFVNTVFLALNMTCAAAVWWYFREQRRVHRRRSPLPPECDDDPPPRAGSHRVRM